MVSFIYITLYCLVLIVCVCCLRHQNENNYWKKAIIPIIVFTIVIGLRWGRAVDWCVYYNVYENFKYGNEEGFEPLFYLIWSTYKNMGLSYPCIIASCSCLFIFSLFYYFRPYAKLNNITITIIVIFITVYSTNLIRFYMAFSFLLIALRNYEDRKYKLAIVFSLCSVMIHIGILVVIPILWFITRKRNLICKPRTTVLICLFFIFFFSREFMTIFAPILHIFSFYDRFANYMTDSAGWLSGSGQNFEDEGRTIISSILNNVALWIVIYTSYDIVKHRKDLVSIYNFAIIGIILYNCSNGLELVSRFHQVFVPFYCFLFALSISTLNKVKFKKTMNMILLIFCLLYCSKRIYVYAMPLTNGALMHFVWDNDKIDPLRLGVYYNN